MLHLIDSIVAVKGHVTAMAERTFSVLLQASPGLTLGSTCDLTCGLAAACQVLLLLLLLDNKV